MLPMNVLLPKANNLFLLHKFSLPWHRVTVLMLISIATVYVGLALYLSSFHALWSPDCGVRFAMIRSQIEHGRLIYIYYPFAHLDPTGRIHPLAYFLFHRAHDFCAMYLPLFPFLSGLAYCVFGFRGLMLVPVLCGLGTLWVTYAMARRLGLRSRLLLIFVLGLATPLLLYSVSFWDHSAQMLLAALAGYWLLRAVLENSFRWAALAGAMLGLGMWVHELFLALFAAMWLAALPFLKQRRYIPGGLLMGFVPTLLTWGAFNLWLYGAFGGAHLSANVLQNNPDHPFSLVQILDQSQLAERAMLQFVGVYIVGSDDDIFPYYLAFFCLLLFYVYVGWSGKSLSRYASFLALVAAGLALWLLLKARGATDGLFLATPVLIPALAIPWYVRRVQATASHTTAFYAWLSRTCWLFALLLLINPMLPGVDWGSRYFLAMLPLLALLAAYALEQQHQTTEGRWRTPASVSVAGLIAISLFCQGSGLLWMRRCLAYDQELNTRIRTISSPVLVTDTDFNARLTNLPSSQASFLVRSDDDSRLFAVIVHQLKLNEVVFVGTEFGEDRIEGALSYSGQSFVRHKDQALWKVDHAREEGDDLRYVRYVVTMKGRGEHGRGNL